MIIKNGSRWGSTDGKVFYVMHTIEVDGHDWVHYKSFDSDQEYSCYTESFLSRFTPLPDESNRKYEKGIKL